MAPDVTPENRRRAELIGDTLRRLVRRGARANLAKLLAKTRPEDVALQLPRLTPSEQLDVYRLLVAQYADSAGEVLVEAEDSVRQALLEEMTPQEIAKVLGVMSVDDAVDVVESLPQDLEERVLEIVDVRNLDEVQEHLSYADQSAGRLMVPSFVGLPASTLVGEAIARLRDSAELDNIFYLYVVDDDGHLVGVASLRQLLLADPERRLEEMMTRSVVKVGVDTDQEEVARLVSLYDLLAIPVTDGDNKLVGIVTVDDVIDVVREEATEDFFKMVGTSDHELIYEDRSFRVAGFRLPWLLVNLAGLVAAGMLIKGFEVTLQEALFLVFFLPVVMGMGGNIGSQTATIAVRGLATGRITTERGAARRFLWQQIKVGALLAIACSAVVFLGSLLIEGANLAYGVVIGVSLFLAILLASLNGTLIPLLFERLGFDPAVASGPLVTTTNDITGILIYFGLASLLIDQLARP